MYFKFTNMTKWCVVSISPTTKKKNETTDFWDERRLRLQIFFFVKMWKKKNNFIWTDSTKPRTKYNKNLKHAPKHRKHFFYGQGQWFAFETHSTHVFLDQYQTFFCFCFKFLRLPQIFTFLGKYFIFKTNKIKRINIYIMQSTLPTTIYVENLSFLVTEIWISPNFFSMGPIYMYGG